MPWRICAIVILAVARLSPFGAISPGTAAGFTYAQSRSAGDGATGLHGVRRPRYNPQTADSTGVARHESRVTIASQVSSRTSQVKGGSMAAQIPLGFEPNLGQAPEGVKFVAHAGSSTLYLTDKGAVLASRPSVQLNRFTVHSDLLYRGVPKEAPAVVDFSPLRASSSGTMVGVDRLPGKVNYFIGSDPTNWQTDIPTFRKVVYRNVYRGIDLVYRGTGARMDYEWVLHPGAVPQRVSFLVASKNAALVRQGLFVSEGRSRTTPTSISRDPMLGSARFERGREPVIHPVLKFSTYLGGSGDDVGNAVRVDRQGGIYLDGFTTSPDFPMRNAIQGHYAGGTCPALTAGNGSRPCFDAFITKLNSTGTAIAYSTYLGGNGDDFGGGMALDGSSNLYVTGWTNSSNFPSVNALQRRYIGGQCRTYQRILIRCREAFVAKLSARGDRLLYSTYLGGKGLTDGWGIAVDKAGNAFVAGSTLSHHFPVVHALQTRYGGGGPGRFDSGDVFVSKLAPRGNKLVYSTYLGGRGADGAPEIVIDGTGNAYVAGVTFSDNFPTVHAFQRHRHGDADAFITKINRGGTGIIYSSYLGGSGAEFPSDIALDARNNAYVGGVTSSSNFPTTRSAYQRPANGGGGDGWIAEVNVRGGLAYSTLIGGKGYDSCEDVTVDLKGEAYCVGITQSADFPHKESLQPFYRGNANAFVVKLNRSGSTLEYSSFLGAKGHTEATSVAVDGHRNVYVMGVTVSMSFPTLHPLQAHLKGARDVWVVKINERRLKG